MKKMSKLNLVCLIITGLAFIVMVTAIILQSTRPRVEEAPKKETFSSELAVVPETRIVYRDREKMVEVEKVITAGILEDGLRDMGMLITQEYYFTEVLSFASDKKIFKTELSLPFSESAYLATYSGTVNAGMAFEKLAVEKDEEKKLIRVTIPAAEIMNIDIDPNSFELYSQKTGLGNPISIGDFNRSLIELENVARDKAIERGLLVNADKNARQLIQNFIFSMVDAEAFKLEFVEA